MFARYSSNRLPGKVLMRFGDRTILDIVADKLLQLQDVGLIVATSNEESDDRIEEWCGARAISCFRGDLEDVANRTVLCLESRNWDLFYRVNADSPFLQPQLMIDALNSFKEDPSLDIATNVLVRSFPYGVAVELLKTKTFLDNVLNFSIDDREHITSYFYRNSQEFNIKNFSYFRNASDVRLVLDTEEDLMALRKLFLTNKNIFDCSTDTIINLINQK